MKCLIILALACASLAQAQDVSVSLGDLPPDKTVKVIYRTTVESTLPLGDSAISNQGTATTGAGTEHLTDDPSQVGAEQATLTSASNTYGPKENLFILEDPIASTSSSNATGATFLPEFLYDANPTPADLDNSFNYGAQWGGLGAGPHVVVYQFNERIVFDGLGYAQRLGGIATADKVPSIEIWVTVTDPGSASLSMAILSETPDAKIDFITTDTSPILRYYPLNKYLNGHYVVFRFAQGTYNPGGAELVLTVDAPDPLEPMAIRDSPTQVTVIWATELGVSYDIQRSTLLGDGNWTTIETFYPGRTGATAYQDQSAPSPRERLFYRFIENTVPQS